jgi:hypothetical protein
MLDQIGEVNGKLILFIHYYHHTKINRLLDRSPQHHRLINIVNVLITTARTTTTEAKSSKPAPTT